MDTKSSSTPSSVSPEARVGTIIANKWQVESLLAVGGMGSVFAARHRNGNRVAIKILHGGASVEERARFAREGEVANAIDHDSVVAVLDDGVTDDGAPFLVMELLHGETLEAHAHSPATRLPLEQILALMDTLLAALERAHGIGIVHRDLKPENLFLTSHGELKVLDLGIARVNATWTSVVTTKKNAIVGTPGFMAPEQAFAMSEAIDARTDLWAVGATMFTLISGEPVHVAKTIVEVVIKSATQPVRSLASVAPSVPSAVVAVVDRALAFRREDRWESAGAMRDALREACDDAFGSPASDVRPTTRFVVVDGALRAASTG
jgi:serine/threonine protein kinase